MTSASGADMSPRCSLHHAHLFASDLERSISFYREMFDAEVVFDTDVAGARNVLLKLGDAHINFYDQPPKDSGRGAVHHLGIRTDNLCALVARMKSKGFEFRKDITDLGPLKYVMASAPDGVLLELFQTDVF
ncbi:MAG: VOC family protein [Candidatus Binatia bacterium]